MVLSEVFKCGIKKEDFLYLVYDYGQMATECRHSELARKLRVFWAKKIIDIKNDCNIERAASFTPNITIG